MVRALNLKICTFYLWMKKIRKEEKGSEEWSNRYYCEYIRSREVFYCCRFQTDGFPEKAFIDIYIYIFWKVERKKIHLARCWDQVPLFWQITVFKNRKQSSEIEHYTREPKTWLSSTVSTKSHLCAAMWGENCLCSQLSICWHGAKMG